MEVGNGRHEKRSERKRETRERNLWLENRSANHRGQENEDKTRRRVDLVYMRIREGAWGRSSLFPPGLPSKRSEKKNSRIYFEAQSLVDPFLRGWTETSKDDSPVRYFSEHSFTLRVYGDNSLSSNPPIFLFFSFFSLFLVYDDGRMREKTLRKDLSFYRLFFSLYCSLFTFFPFLSLSTFLPHSFLVPSKIGARLAFCWGIEARGNWERWGIAGE